MGFRPHKTKIPDAAVAAPNTVKAETGPQEAAPNSGNPRIPTATQSTDAKRPERGKTRCAIPIKIAPSHPSAPSGYENINRRIPNTPKAANRVGIQPATFLVMSTSPTEPMGKPIYRGIRPIEPCAHPPHVIASKKIPTEAANNVHPVRFLRTVPISRPWFPRCSMVGCSSCSWFMISTVSSLFSPIDTLCPLLQLGKRLQVKPYSLKFFVRHPSHKGPRHRVR